MEVKTKMFFKLEYFISVEYIYFKSVLIYEFLLYYNDYYLIIEKFYMIISNEITLQTKWLDYHKSYKIFWFLIIFGNILYTMYKIY